MLTKVCGITRLDDALLAATLGANALGFIFWPPSPRFIDPDDALAIVAALPPFVTTVGVFVNQPKEHVADVARRLNLGAVQLHGEETPDSYPEPPLKVIKGIGLASGADVVETMRTVPASATVLLDAHDPIKRGGTGRTIDWTSAAAAARIRPIVLSGGLNAENVAAAINIVRPYAVDVSSGVESSPGVKDAARLRTFFAAIALSTAVHSQQ